MTGREVKSARMTVEELADFYGFDLELPTPEEIEAARKYREEQMAALELNDAR